MSKINQKLDELTNNYNVLKTSYEGLVSEVTKLSLLKADNVFLLEKIKELELYISKLEGIISGYGVSFNNTLNEYKNSIKEEIYIHSKKAIETSSVNEVVTISIDKITSLLKNHYLNKVVDNNLLSKSLDSIIDTLKQDLLIKVEETTKVSNKIKPFSPLEFTHSSFNKLLACLKAGIIPFLVGPSGTGKSTAVEQAARALNLMFYTANRVQNAFELTGYNDASGKYVSTQFYEAYKYGGLFFFDEVDASAPEALVTINTAIAQKYMSFPGDVIPVDMHKDFKMVAAGNTYGNGSSREYCGRNALDAATLDRFMVIEWDYDRSLEEKLISDKQLLWFCWNLRNVCESSRLHIIISTRGILATSKIIVSSNGVFSVSEALRGNLFEGLNKDTILKLLGGLDALDKVNISKLESKWILNTNPYYLATKSLVAVLK
ncbi:MAG: AAA family ATPase [Acholeplasmatales bacterium]|jgi:hypothetical protein|nr:AAA family ATPase [Acholeplasmatales bacterium]